MAADAAGAVQEARHGAVRRTDPGSGAAYHPCGPGLPVGIPLQTIANLNYKVLIVLFLISRRQLLPDCFVKPDNHVLDIKTTSPWLQMKAAPCFHEKQHHHGGDRAVSSWTGSTREISTYFTSGDSTSTRTSTKRLSVSGRREGLENSALRENYRHEGAITEIKELAESAVNVLSGFAVARKYARVNFGRTLRATTAWTLTNLEACRRVRLKRTRVTVPVGSFSVADLNSNVVECLHHTWMFASTDGSNTRWCLFCVQRRWNVVKEVKYWSQEVWCEVVLYVEASYLLSREIMCLFVTESKIFYIFYYFIWK